MKLETIQTKECLNEVHSVGDKGNDGAYHKYSIIGRYKQNDLNIQECFVHFKFQDGPRFENDSKHGIIDSDLLEIVRHRLQCFQEGPFKNDYNEAALKHVEAALHCLNDRVEDRIKRNVLGTNNK